jgi:hypothetical protein
MASTGVEIPGFGSVNVCVGDADRPGCVLQAAAGEGYLSPREGSLLRGRIKELEGQVEALKVALERHPSIEVVDADEVLGRLSMRFGAAA